MWKQIVMYFAAMAYGCLSSAGVLTVFIAVGLVPRFAGKTHTADKAFLYENMVVAGTIIGGGVSVFQEWLYRNQYKVQIAGAKIISDILGKAGMLLYGFFAGIFVGCLALSIAEMLDSIPILARRTKLRRGLSMAILAMALGKLAGSILYFGTIIKMSKP